MDKHKRNSYPKLLKDRPIDSNTDPANDDPVRLSWNSLNALVVNIVHNILPDLDCYSPLLISGDWGAGKTSLLKRVQNELKNQDIPTIWFDAWNYESEGELLPALIRCIWKVNNNSQSNTTKDTFEKAFKIATAISIKTASHMFGLGAIRLKHIADDIKEIDLGKPELSSTMLLADKIESLLKELSNNPEIKPVIFIDDLDRCNPENALMLLDGIRTLLNISQKNEIPCKLLVIMDKKALATAIRSKFSNLTDYDSNRYLEKMFPRMLTIPTPSLKDIADFIGLQIDELMKINHNRITENDGFIFPKEEFIEVLSKPNYANPRLIKRCINRLFLFNCFESEAGKEITRSMDLILWISTTERWPILRPLINRKPDRFWNTLYQELDKELLSDGDAKELVSQPGFREFLGYMQQGDVARKFEIFNQYDKALMKYGL